MRRTRRDDGAMSVELVAFVPILAIVTLLLVQGFIALSSVSSIENAARDGARAASLGRDAGQAVRAQLPDRLILDDVSRYPCGSGQCVSVEARVPVGVPGIAVHHVTVTRSVAFPRG